MSGGDFTKFQIGLKLPFYYRDYQLEKQYQIIHLNVTCMLVCMCYLLFGKSLF